MFSNSFLKSLWLLLVALLILLENAVPFQILVFLSFIAIAAPLIREFRKRSDLDERQMEISHYSSHIAYFVFLFLLGLGFINEWMIKGQRPELIMFLLLFIPISAKVVICLFQNYGSPSGPRGFARLFFRGIVPADKAIDERQNVIGNFSSHIAFYVYTIMVVAWSLYRFNTADKHPGNLWNMLLLVPMLIKFYISLFKNYGAGTGARIICFVIAGIWLLFVLLSHGISLEMIIEATPFLLLTATAFLSHRFPKVTGSIFILLGIGSLTFFHWHNFEIYQRLLMYSIIPLPLVLSGSALLSAKKYSDE
jgi:hypothetical protein